MIEVESYCYIVQENDDDVENILEIFEVFQFVFFNFQDFFDGVVDDEKDEDVFVGYDEMVEGGDVMNQFDCVEGEGWDIIVCGWVFKYQFIKIQQE